MKYSAFFSRFKKTITIKVIAIKFIFLLLFQIGLPTATWALTSGPGQQEYASFEPASTSDLVNIYNGSFTYNIPLLSVPGPNGGYPINIAYHSGIGMDQEASWVGLGWTLNLGAINRNLNGIPDDINGENIERNQTLRNSVTTGVGITAASFAQTSLYGLDYGFYGERYGQQVNGFSGYQTPELTSNIQIFYNNYRGIGVGGDLSFNFRRYDPEEKHKNKISGALGLSYDSNSGIGISASTSITHNDNLSRNLGVSMNTRNGLNGVNYSLSWTFPGKKDCTFSEETKLTVFDFVTGSLISGDYSQNHENYYVRSSSSISFSVFQSVPTVNYNSNSYSIHYTNRIVGETYNLQSLFTYIYGGFGYWDIETLPHIQGFYSMENLKDNNWLQPSFGYMNTSNGNSNREASTDYQFQQTQYSKNLPHLPSSRPSYDGFIMTGQGIGGSFRFFKDKQEIYSPSDAKNKNISANVGLEAANSTTSSNKHTGIDLGAGVSTTTTGAWDSEDFQAIGQNGYFKLNGEKSGHYLSENQLSQNWGGDRAVRYKTSWNEGAILPEYGHTSELVYNQNTSTSITTSDGSAIKSNERRSHVINNLNGSQARKYGFTREGSNSYQYIDATGTNEILQAKQYSYSQSHISEIQVTQPNGMKYIYGLPAYNKGQKEVVSSIQYVESLNNNIVDLNDNSNQGTNNEFKSETKLPDYAHSWLLTHIVGPDYVDKDDIPGPSDGDLGYWVKITYKKKNNDYKWRIPYEGAYFHKGHVTDNQDNTGSFSYGTKEIYYVYSIETKTHIAIFDISQRRDGHESYEEYAVQADAPGPGSSYKLDNISLYTKTEYFLNDCVSINPNATAIQKVHFEYDYSLCPNVPNNDGSVEMNDSENINENKGKLTLRKIIFYSENSKRGELSPYEFTYSETNPEYNTLNIDRWGCYKDNGNNVDYPSVDFPYTEQPRSLAPSESGPESGVWSLTKIKLPTGGELEINYEPNEYGHVENQPAMRMFDIVGVGNSIDLGSGAWGDERILADMDNANSSPWYLAPNDQANLTINSVVEASRNQVPAIYANLENENDAHDGFRVFFELEKEISMPEINAMGYQTPQEYVRKKLLRGMRKMYFKNYTNLKASYYDYVGGYVDILYPLDPNLEWKYLGLCKDVNGIGNFKVGYVTLNKVPVNKKRPPIVHCNEMTRHAMEFLRTDRPDIAYSTMPQIGTFSGNGNGLAVITNFLTVAIGGGLINDALSAFFGHNLWTYSKQYCRFIQLNGKSVIRLYDENDKKFGGGDRVSMLSIKDNWKNDINQTQASIYGQEYIYTLDGTKEGKSSGVAYEPQIGAEESALRQPIEYEESANFLSSSYTTFLEKPLMEKFYPGPSVGYSKVYVKSLSKQQAENENVTFSKQAAPITVYEFFTPKDFPVIEDATDLSTDIPFISFINIPGIYSFVKVSKIRSQGYSVITNDMAGRPKSMKTYRRNDDNTLGAMIGGQEFEYCLKNNYNENAVNELSSEVQALSVDQNGELQLRTAIIGQEMDVFAERQESKSVTYNFTFGSDFEINTGPPVFVLPLIHAKGDRTENTFKTVVLHKVIHRTANLKKTHVITDQSTITTENLAYDIETGDPILTKVNNGYEDPIYKLNYPAHWYYKGMGAAYKSSEIDLQTATANTSQLQVGSNFEISGSLISGIIQKLNQGDEFYLESYATPNTGYYGYITFVDQSTNIVYAIFKDGSNNTGTISGAIKRFAISKSGIKNQQSAKSGEVSFKTLSGYTSTPLNNYTPVGYGKVLNASAIKFKDEWQGECVTCDNLEAGFSGNVNPFVYGFKGIWRAYESYAYNTSRNYNNNSREDGFFNEFTPFNWSNTGTNDPNWISAGKITKYSRYGFELENKDALGIYSAALYGYGNSLATAICQNSKYHEMFFDGFEDYVTTQNANCKNCTERHLNFQAMNMANGVGHTGKNSLMVPNNSNVTLINIESKESQNCEDYSGFSEIGWIEGVLSTVYKSNPCDCLPKFHFVPGKEYLISFWIKDQNASIPHPMVYEGGVSFTFKNNSTVINSTTISPDPITDPKNRVIEGWQRVSGKIVIPSNATSVDIAFLNSSSANGITYYDDFRIHPYKAMMKSFVYDFENYRLLAELDDNNYATFYIYDEAGSLIMIKKETEKGIKTISEGRSSVIK